MNKPTNITNTNEYKTFITDIKSKINYTQVKIASTINSALLHNFKSTLPKIEGIEEEFNKEKPNQEFNNKRNSQ